MTLNRTPSPRRDAQRNRERLLVVARGLFERDGLEAPMDAIAKAAGVGSGTLYRHFPAKDDLVAAAIGHDEPCLETQRKHIAATATDALTALEQWLDALRRKMVSYDGLAGSLRAAVDSPSTPLGITCQQLIATTEEFLAPVRASGLAHPELDGRGLFLATLGIAWASAAFGADPRIQAQLSTVLHSGWSR